MPPLAGPNNDAGRFFASYFSPVRVGEGTAFATGYFEPEIAGSRTRRSPTDVPVYGVPQRSRTLLACRHPRK